MEASVAKIRPPTRKSVAPKCEPCSVPSKLRAMRRKSASVMGCGSVDYSFCETMDCPQGSLKEKGRGWDVHGCFCLLLNGLKSYCFLVTVEEAAGRGWTSRL